VKLLGSDEARLEPMYEFGIGRQVGILLSTGRRIEGVVRVYLPAGRDRLSDYARGGERFRYVEAPEGTFIVNFAHVVELREMSRT
jgi:hypothetical protein